MSYLYRITHGGIDVATHIKTIIKIFIWVIPFFIASFYL